VKIFYDTEFLENGHTIDPISIGMVREDGKELYCVVNDVLTMQWAVQRPWLRANVVPSLPVKTFDHELGLMVAEDRFGRSYEFGNMWEWDTAHPDYPCVMDRRQVLRKVREFVLTTPKPELWAWYGAYDHVVLAQLFGTMAQLPEAFPMITCDLKQEAMRLGNPPLPKQAAGKHNALADARHNRVIWQALQMYPLRPVEPAAMAAAEGRREPRLAQYPIGGISGNPENSWSGGWE
jgi:hypothetical protein